MNDLTNNFERFEISKPGKTVAITDTVGFVEALIVLVEKLNEVMEFVEIEGEDEKVSIEEPHPLTTMSGSLTKPLQGGEQE